MLFDHPEYDDHVCVTFFSNPETGLRLIHAQHRLVHARCAGGIRFKSYAASDDAVRDALRLSRAMTYKFALADLPMGGAKTVVIGDPSRLKTRELLKALGAFIHGLGGQYLCGSDVGTNMADMKILAEVTPYVAGKERDTSHATAIGTFNAIRATAQFLFGAGDLRGRSVAVQGAGGVGHRLCKLLTQAGAHVQIADTDSRAAQATSAETGATVVPADTILGIGADILAPCALGGILDDDTIPRLRVRGVCGCANNQLATSRDGELLFARGIAFVPDFVASAGGIIGGSLEAGLIEAAGYERRLAGIYDTTLRILQQSREHGVPPDVVAQMLARGLPLTSTGAPAKP